MKIPFSLKLDFKITDGVLRIFDIGDGLSSGIRGFEGMQIDASLLRYLCDVNQSALATIFGELPLEAMHSKNLDIPIIPRNIDEKSWFDGSDLSAFQNSILPYSHVGRLQSYISYFWSKNLVNKVVPTPMSLIGMEMHKLLWYTLMEKHLPPNCKDNIVFWSNYNSVENLNLSNINMDNGVFIKIADRSDGRGEGVFYAKDTPQVMKILTKLHREYKSDSQNPFAKHIFMIEPAYQTIRDHSGEKYNVTGRAFVTLSFDTDTRKLEVKIAGAKWMFPTEPLKESKTQAQMLSNLDNKTAILALSSEDLELLSQQIIEIYGDVFRAAIEHNNLMEYCKGNPVLQEFISVLRPGASYKLMTNCDSEFVPDCEKQGYLMRIIDAIIVFQHLPSVADIKEMLSTSEKNIYNFFKNKQYLLELICSLSFLEKYIAFIEVSDASRRAFGGDILYENEKIKYILGKKNLVTQKLDSLIKKFLAIKNPKYDLQNMNRALRQAAGICDTEVVKLLIGTQRASVLERSPKTQKTALDFAKESELGHSERENCIKLLQYAMPEENRDFTSSLATVSCS